MIRDVHERDARAIAEIYSPYVTDSPISFEVDPPAEEEMVRRISRYGKDYPWLVFESAGELSGYAYAAPFHARAAYRFSVEVSIYVRSDLRGGGVGRSLMEALLLDLERRRFAQAFAGIALPNEASVRLFESLGFEPVGVFRRVGYKLGTWHDVGWWQRSLRPAIPGASGPEIMSP